MTKKTEEEKEQRSGLIDAVREIPSLYDKSNLDYMTDSKKTSTKWAEVATTERDEIFYTFSVIL
jgi:hypothetical protein